MKFVFEQHSILTLVKVAVFAALVALAVSAISLWIMLTQSGFFAF